MQSPQPLTNDVVFVGGGHAHALVLRKWGMKPIAGARLTLINPAPTAPYTGMLPGHIAGHYDRDALEIDLVRLARFAGARFVQGTVTGLDRDRGLVHLADHGDIRFDLVSLDVGITSDMPRLPGFVEHGVAAKPLAGYATRWAAFCDEVIAGHATPEVAVIGAGVAGIELALAMHHRLSTLGAEPKVTVIDAGEALQGTAGSTRSVLFDRLYRAEIRVLEHTPIAEILATSVLLKDGRNVPAALTIGAAGARPHDWIADLGLTHEAGYLSVDPSLRSVDDDRIFGAGDCIHLVHAPRPKAGVYAVRAAPILHDNLRAALTGGARKTFKPQSDFLKLISLGTKEAVGDKSGITLSGPWLWTQKDRIDQAFMTKLDKLPSMAKPALPQPHTRALRKAVAGPMPCAGCGAKIGSDALSSALERLPASARPDILTGRGDDAAVLDIGGQRQALTTDHLRAFTDDPVLLTRIAAVHALGDIWAMGAQPQAALATLILPHMSDPMQRETLREIMDTAAQTFGAEGAEIVGGHSSLGTEMTIGFSVTGLCDADPIGLAGAKPGDALILTKPIGTGVLLAGDMTLKTRGPDLMRALSTMAQSQGAAARTLATAHAMTDVTGFGLAGHLMEICEASGVAAALNMAQLPIYPGAEALAKRGVASTLAPANQAALAGRVEAEDTPRTALLYDPQTAGGLLAAVDPETARERLAALTKSDLPATVIGHITDGPPRITAM